MESLPLITSRDNQYVKLACSLKSKKGREQSGCFLLEGLRLAGEAAATTWPLKFALADAEAADQSRARALLCHLRERRLPVYTLPPGLFAQVADTEHSQGLLLIAQQPPIRRQLPDGVDFLLLADRLADPGNLGAIMRTAWAAGADALLLSPGSADPCSPKAARASMGAVLRLPLLCFEDEAALLALLRERGLALYAAAAGGESRYDMARLEQPLVWLLGAEAVGLSPFWRQAATHSVYLPMAKGAESLNVAAAAAVLLYATAARRGFPKAGSGGDTTGSTTSSITSEN
jgi:TrmH family RNA methyltransferase